MKFILIALAVVIVGILGTTAYLSPNDLAHCGTHPSEAKPCQAAEAIVAVSGGDTAARTREAIKLYQNGWAPKLIFSGAAQDKSGPSNAAVMKSEAHAAGVPDSDILTEEYSETTKQNAIKTQSIFETHNITSVILVTSAYHQRRAGLEFASRSNDVQVRNHPVASDNQWSNWWWLTPTGWYLALSELVKIAVFYVGGSR